ncbi:MAG: hypothetical protein M0C28_41320 [Candidatus Moduliflexus flocculans]|nr:hypothetical protein [Candidatus Moduliflexus flocculans]
MKESLEVCANSLVKGAIARWCRAGGCQHGNFLALGIDHLDVASPGYRDAAPFWGVDEM